MFVVWWHAAAHGCTPTTARQVASVDAPAIVVLGERHGKKSDLRNAAAVIEALPPDTEVTVAVEAVAAEHQGVMERLEAGEIRPKRVRELTDWEASWGHPFRPYLPLLSVSGVQWIAAGPPLGPPPDGAELQIPAEYDDQLRGQARAHGLTDEEVPGFSAAQAWRDLRIAQLALEGWSGRGVLIIVAGRGHVAEGRGVTWQLEHGLSTVPVTSALLSRGHTCGDSDRYLP